MQGSICLIKQEAILRYGGIGPSHGVAFCSLRWDAVGWTAEDPGGKIGLSALLPTLRSVMKRLVPIPSGFVDHLKRAEETGIGYQVVSVELRDGRSFDQVVTSEGCIIEVRGHQEIPFASEDVASVSVNHKGWNFRDVSDAHRKCKAATA